MEVERFRNSPVGVVVPISGTDTRFGETYEHWAFVPHALPAEVELSPAARDAVTEAALARRRRWRTSARSSAGTAWASAS